LEIEEAPAIDRAGREPLEVSDQSGQIESQGVLDPSRERVATLRAVEHLVELEVGVEAVVIDDETREATGGRVGGARDLLVVEERIEVGHLDRVRRLERAKHFGR